jgi:hypothetical protein
LSSNTQVTSSNTVINLGSLTLTPGTYIVNLYGLSSGTGVTKASISLSDTSTQLNDDVKNGYLIAGWSTNALDMMHCSGVITISSSRTYYLNALLISASLGTNYTAWVANKCGVTATRITQIA